MKQILRKKEGGTADDLILIEPPGLSGHCAKCFVSTFPMLPSPQSYEVESILNLTSQRRNYCSNKLQGCEVASLAFEPTFSLEPKFLMISQEPQAHPRD